MIVGISFIWLYVSDLERSIRFYGDSLGLGVSRRWHEGATFDLGDVVLGLHIEEGKVTRGNSPTITFKVTGNIEELYDDLVRRGVRFVRAVTTEPYGKIATFEDPDGHALLLHQPPEPPAN
jgi:predicted enzyme related to lactoylglutathione lyase